MGEEAKDEGLHEARPRQLALTLDEAAGVGGSIGDGRQDRLQHSTDVRDAGHMRLLQDGTGDTLIILEKANCCLS
jgi:hypothetical protein